MKSEHIDEDTAYIPDLIKLGKEPATPVQWVRMSESHAESDCVVLYRIKRVRKYNEDVGRNIETLYVGEIPVSFESEDNVNAFKILDEYDVGLYGLILNEDNEGELDSIMFDYHTKEDASKRWRINIKIGDVANVNYMQKDWSYKQRTFSDNFLSAVEGDALIDSFDTPCQYAYIAPIGSLTIEFKDSLEEVLSKRIEEVLKQQGISRD